MLQVRRSWMKDMGELTSSRDAHTAWKLGDKEPALRSPQRINKGMGTLRDAQWLWCGPCGSGAITLWVPWCAMGMWFVGESSFGLCNIMPPAPPWSVHVSPLTFLTRRQKLCPDSLVDFSFVSCLQTPLRPCSYILTVHHTQSFWVLNYGFETVPDFNLIY